MKAPKPSEASASGFYDKLMSDQLEQAFDRLVDQAPKAACSLCNVPMMIRTLVPTGPELYRATFRCPKCHTEKVEEFRAADS